jgi:alkylation response protein AidB-like acyl-CoA dehydrogenase
MIPNSYPSLDFGLGDTADMLRDSVRSFTSDRIAPIADEVDKSNTFPRHLWPERGALGLLGITVEEEFGGSGLGYLEHVVAMEEVSRGSASVGLSYGAHSNLCVNQIRRNGNDEQKRRYLPKLISGEHVGALAMSEAGSGSDVVSMRLAAVKKADRYVLNGTKMWITNAGFADVFVVFAKVVGDKVTCFIVEKTFPGVSTGAEEHKMGINGSSTRTLILEDAKVPAENLLGEIGKGHKIAFNCLNMGRLKLGAGAVGGSKFCLGDAIRYSLERTAFGKPIAEFGLIQQKIAECCIRIFASESMSYRTAALIDGVLAGISHDALDGSQQILKGIEEYATECSIMKVMGSEILGYVCDEAVQIYGGYGYSRDYPVERFYRDARINRIFEGTNEINRLLIPGMLLRRAMKGELPLIPAAQKLMDEIMGFPALEEASDELLAQEKKFVSNTKKIALMTAGAAVQKYMDKVGDEQEVMGHISNILMEVYACESSLLRALKTAFTLGEEKAQLHLAMTRMYITEAAPRIEAEAKFALAAIAEGDMLRTQLAALKRFSKYTPIDVVKTGRLIARAALAAQGWPIKTH